MTFSIIARCVSTGMFGVGVCSSSPAVGARCAYARSGVGVVSSQNITDPTLGPLALDLLASGMTADEAGIKICNSASHIEYRQLLILDSSGTSFVHSGSETLGTWSFSRADNVACAGNLLSNENVPRSMSESFESSSGHLAERLLLSLESGLSSGGESGPVHSASIKVVSDVSWPIVDLRIDWSDDCPISSLRNLWELYSPQVDDYVCRALDPRTSPSYGVPGDE